MKKLGVYYNIFIILVIIIKIIFVIFAILTKYYKYKLKYSNKSKLSYYTKQYNFTNYWKEKLETIFMICMGFICIIIFNPFPRYKFIINDETRILLFLFGIITIFTTGLQLF